MSNQPVALVTGATNGIGRAIAFELGRAGYAVGVTARTSSAVEALTAELTGAGVRAAGVVADVSRVDDVVRLGEGIERKLGPIDVLVNNAGIAPSGSVVDTAVEQWDQVFATNVRGIFLTCRMVIPGMKSRGRGDIVNIASLAGKNGIANLAAYSASKHAVLGFSKSLLLEVRKLGIRVIAICPGSVDTPLLRGQTAFSPNLDKILKPEDVSATVLEALRLPRRATVSELEIRPSDP